MLEEGALTLTVDLKSGFGVAAVDGAEVCP